MRYQGTIEKMKSALGGVVEYALPIGEELLPMNPLIGSTLSLLHNGEIHCVGCGRRTSKSFNQGYCYPCFRALPQCDSCIIKPEQCHYHEGTCRDSLWGEQHCLQDHYVYLANSSGVKVGVTRGTQIPIRWMDQGAVQALPIFRTSERLTAGLIEVAMKAHVADKTSWQRMLKGEPEFEDLPQWRDTLFESCKREFEAITRVQGEGAMVWLEQESMVDIRYPVDCYPVKVKSLNFDKTPEVSGRLMGIKGQYLILDSGVLNIRKFGGYQLAVETKE